MPLPDTQPILNNAAEVGFIKWLGGILFGTLGTLLGIIYTKHEKDFDKLEAKVEKKADKEAVDKDLGNGSDKFEQIMAELRTTNAGLADLKTLMLTELGKRPTREEMRDYCQSMHQQRGI